MGCCKGGSSCKQEKVNLTAKASAELEAEVEKEIQCAKGSCNERPSAEDLIKANTTEE